jgi:serine/threonine protein kinase
VRFDHPNIVRTFELGRTDGRYFISMEYIGGKDLTQILRRCQEQSARIPVPHACYIAAKMCEGLHYAHTFVDSDGKPLAIVNRDVSPSNVRIGYDGEVKLLDFGIAQAMEQFTSEIGILKGKFSYMSPEQIRGMPVDARTDVFSTGIILHEMLTTEKLFRGDTEFQLMERVRNVEVLPPSKYNRRVNEALDRIVMKALARDVADRYQTAQELAKELNAFLASYKFDKKELVEHVRSLFRADFDVEQAETRACLQALLPADEGREASLLMSTANIESAISGEASESLQIVIGGGGPGSELSEIVVTAPQNIVPADAHTPSMPTPAVADPITQTGEQQRQTGPRAGLWSRLRDRFTREPSK